MDLERPKRTNAPMKPKERKMIYVDNKTEGMAYGAESTQEMIREVVKHLDDDVIRVNITRRKPLDDGDERKDGGTEEFSLIKIALTDGSCVHTPHEESLWARLDNRLSDEDGYIKVGEFVVALSDIVYIQKVRNNRNADDWTLS